MHEFGRAAVIPEDDIVFADPPYHLSQEQFENIVTLILKNEILDQEGMLIVEHSKETKLEHLENFSFAKHYGGTTFSFFEFEFDEEEDVDDDSEEDFDDSEED